MSPEAVREAAAASALSPGGSVGPAGAGRRPRRSRSVLGRAGGRARLTPGGSETARPPGASNSTASPMTRGCTRSLRRRHARPCAVASSSISTKLWRGCPRSDCSSGQTVSWSPVVGVAHHHEAGRLPGRQAQACRRGQTERIERPRRLRIGAQAHPPRPVVAPRSGGQRPAQRKSDGGAAARREAARPHRDNRAAPPAS